jgi:hypothetical protein
MVEGIRTDLDLAEMERQDAEAYARQPQDPDEIADWGRIQDWGDVDEAPVDDLTSNDGLPESFRLWLARADALAAEILARRKGKPLDLDAILRADRADLEARDDDIIRGLA